MTGTTGQLEFVDGVFRFPEPDAGIQLPVAFDRLDFPALPDQGQHIMSSFRGCLVELLAAAKLARSGWKVPPESTRLSS